MTLLQVYSHQQTVEEKDEFLAGLETYLRDPGDVVLLVSCCQAARDCCSRIQTTLLSNQVSNTINFQSNTYQKVISKYKIHFREKLSK